MHYSVYSFPLKSNQATLVVSRVYLQRNAISLNAAVSTWPISGIGTLALSAQAQVLSPYSWIPLMIHTNILSHKVSGAEFTLGRTARVLGLLFLLSPGSDSSGDGITTLDHWFAGSGRMQVFTTDEKAYAGICADVGSMPLMLVLEWIILGLPGLRRGVTIS